MKSLGILIGILFILLSPFLPPAESEERQLVSIIPQEYLILNEAIDYVIQDLEKAEEIEITPLGILEGTLSREDMKAPLDSAFESYEVYSQHPLRDKISLDIPDMPNEVIIDFINKNQNSYPLENVLNYNLISDHQLESMWEQLRKESEATGGDISEDDFIKEASTYLFKISRPGLSQNQDRAFVYVYSFPVIALCACDHFIFLKKVQGKWNVSERHWECGC